MKQDTQVSGTAYRWAMLTGLCLLYCCFALVHFSTSSLADVIIADLGLSLVQMGSIMGAWPMAYIAVALPAGVVLDRFGVRYGLLAGILTIALSCALRAQAESYLELYLAVLLFGFGAPFISVGTPKLIREWFDYSQRGLALGIATAMVAVGSILGLNLSQFLLALASGQWRSVLSLYFIVCLVVSAVWLFVILNPRSRSRDECADHESLEQVLAGCRGLLANPGIQKFMLLSVGVFFFVHATINWLPSLLARSGIDSTVQGAALWASVPVLVAVVSAAGVHQALRVSSEKTVLVSLFCMAGLSSLLFICAEFVYGTMLALVFVGVVRGALPPVCSLILIHMPGVEPRNTGVVTGLFFSFGQVGGVLGPLVFGYLADWRADFLYALLVLALLCSALAILALTLKPLAHVPVKQQ